MAGEKLSPRQQMIGLMYLVLLAMLAMNASKDLLNAFFELDKAINVTNENLAAGNESVYNKIQNAAALGSNKAVIALKQADEIKKEAKDLTDLLSAYKTDIIEMGGGVDPETGIPFGKDNQDVGAEYMLVKKKGEALKSKINAFESKLLGVVDDKDEELRKSISDLLKTPTYVDYEGTQSSWESGISEHLPLVAVTANLSNLETYVKNAETQVLSYLHEGIAADSYKVNKILATTTSDKSYLLQGDQYNANVFLAAADTTQEPIILIGEYDTALYQRSGKIKFLGAVDSLPVRGGIGNYRVKTDETGTHQWGGIMKVPHPNPKRKGEFLMYPFESSYTVAAPTAVISSDKLSIMYLKMDNEINISAPGIDPENIEVVASNRCLVSKIANGKFKFKPTRVGAVNITVFAKQDGERKQIATQKWTAKKLPKPIITFLNKPIQKYTRKQLLKIASKQKFEARYSDEFPLTAKVDIKSCGVEIFNLREKSLEPTEKCSKGVFNSRLKNRVKRVRTGDKIYINMKVVGPDGISHNLSEMTSLK